MDQIGRLHSNRRSVPLRAVTATAGQLSRASHFTIGLADVRGEFLVVQRIADPSRGVEHREAEIRRPSPN